jgi:hypothetical protein
MDLLGIAFAHQDPVIRVVADFFYRTGAHFPTRTNNSNCFNHD